MASLDTGLARRLDPRRNDRPQAGPEGREFVRATEPGKTGFVEQPLTLADPKPGWVVSVTARRERGNQVAEVVKVVLER